MHASDVEDLRSMHPSLKHLDTPTLAPMFGVALGNFREYLAQMRVRFIDTRMCAYTANVAALDKIAEGNCRFEYKVEFEGAAAKELRQRFLDFLKLQSLTSLMDAARSELLLCSTVISPEMNWFYFGAGAHLHELRPSAAD